MRDFLLGLILSVIYSILVLPQKTGKTPNISFTFYPFLFKGMFFIPISKEKSIHIHHWLIFLSILCFHKYLPSILVGFSLGLCVQGLTYNDAFSFVVANPYIH